MPDMFPVGFILPHFSFFAPGLNNLFHLSIYETMYLRYNYFYLGISHFRLCMEPFCFGYMEREKAQRPMTSCIAILHGQSA